MDDQNEISRVIEAVLKEYDENATLEARQQAQQYCTRFKQSPKASWLAFHLLHPKNPSPIRMFGEHVLEDVIKTNWSHLEPATRLGIRRSLLEFLLSGLKDMMVEESYIKSKAATLIVEIALRDWIPGDGPPPTGPGSGGGGSWWVNLPHDIAKIAAAGDTQAEVVMLIWKTLAEELRSDSFQRNSIPRNRLRLLISGLDTLVPHILAFFHEVIEKSYANRNSGNGRPEKLMGTALESTLAYVEWVHLPQLFQTNFGKKFCALLSEVPRACECILVILNRSDKTHLQFQLFPFDHMQDIARALTVATSNATQFSTNGTDYAFLKRLCQVLTLLGMKHLSMPSLQLPSSYQAFIKIMMDLTRHPSLLIADFLLPFWHNFLPNPGWYLDFCKELLQRFEGKTRRIAPREDQNSKNAEEVFAQLDFETQDDFDVFFARARIHLSAFYCNMGRCAPLLAVTYLEKRLTRVLQLLANYYSTTSTPPLTKKTPQYLEFDAACAEIGAVYTPEKGIPNQVLQDSQNPISLTTKRLLKLLLECRLSDSILVEEQVEALCSLGSYYDHNSTAVEYVLTLVLKLLVYRAPSEQAAGSNGSIPISALSAATLRTRLKAGKALITFCRTLPNTLLSLLEKFINIIKELLISGELVPSQQIQLFEALAALARGMTDNLQRERFLSSMLARVIDEWRAPEVGQLLADPSNFIKTSGILEHATEPRHLRLFHLLHVLSVVWKHIAPLPSSASNTSALSPLPHPLAALAPVIYPNLLAFIRSLHWIWSPTCRLQLNERIPSGHLQRMLYTPAPARFPQALKKLKPLPRLAPSLSVEKWRDHLEGIREYAYTLLNQFLTHHHNIISGVGSFSSSKLPIIHVLDNTEWIALQHFPIFYRELLEGLGMLANTVPSECGWIVPTVEQAALTTYQSIAQLWDTYSSRPGQTQSTESNQEQDQMKVSDEPNDSEADESRLAEEMLNDKLLYDATRAFVALHQALFFVEGIPTRQEDPSQTFSQLRIHEEYENDFLDDEASPKKQRKTLIPRPFLQFLIDTNTLGSVLKAIVHVIRAAHDDTSVHLSLDLIATVLQYLPATALSPSASNMPASQLSPYISILGTDFAWACIAVIRSERQLEHSKSRALSLFRILFDATHGPASLGPTLDILTQIVGQNDNNIIRQFLFTYNKTPSQKRKNVLQSLFHNCGVYPDSRRPSRSAILNIPEQYFTASLQSSKNADLPYELISALYKDQSLFAT